MLNAFLAKHIGSAIFVGGRGWQEIQRHELRVGIFRLPQVKVSYTAQYVCVSLWGWQKRYAYFRPGYGCTLCKPAEKPAAVPARPLPAQTATHTSSSYTTSDWQKRIAPWTVSKGSQTLALCIIQGGVPVATWYAPGIKPSTPLAGWSMVKSVTNALVGILVSQGRIDIHAPLPDGIWRGRQDRRNTISMHHLLQMSSGLSWTERYWWDSDVTRMLFDSEDASHIITGKKYGRKPASYWQYASGTTNMISKALSLLLDKEYHSFPYKELFAPLGMSSALIETDATGKFVTSSYMLANAADWAKFGQLYAQGGIWNGKRILPHHWVRYSTTPTDAAPHNEYGAHFWLNQGFKGDPQSRKMPDVPPSVYYASGFGGQRIFIVPTHDLVLVRLGAAHFREPDFNNLLSSLLADLQIGFKNLPKN